MSMDVEETIRAHPLDAVVLLAACDKTVPAQLMGAASAEVPAIMLTGGPARAGHFKGRELGVGTDLWEYTTDYARRAACRRPSTTSSRRRRPVGRALQRARHRVDDGLAWSRRSGCRSGRGGDPRGRLAPGRGARRPPAARAVELATAGCGRQRILTVEALENAISVLMAIGGSTNAVIHLLALAGRVGVDLSSTASTRSRADVRVLANLRPSGDHLFEDLFRAGGVPAP